MKWYYPDRGELPDVHHVDIYGHVVCFCVFKGDRHLEFDSERYDITVWEESNKRFELNDFCYYPKSIECWCYLDEAIDKLRE